MRTPPLAHSPSIHPFVEQRNDTHRLRLCRGGGGNLPGCRLDFQESAMSMTLQAAVPKRRPRRAARRARLCGAAASLIAFPPRACDSLIKYSYIPCKYTENTVNPQSAACPPPPPRHKWPFMSLTRKKKKKKKNPQMSHSLQTPPPFLFLSILPKLENDGRFSNIRVFDVPAPSTQPARPGH